MSLPETTEQPVHAESEEHLDDLVAEYDVVIADFYADWCGPCKMLEPTLEEVAEETGAVVAKVDIEQLREFAQSEGIRSVPTVQFYADGEKAEQLVGVQEKSDLVALVERLE